MSFFWLIGSECDRANMHHSVSSHVIAVHFTVWAVRDGCLKTSGTLLTALMIPPVKCSIAASPSHIYHAYPVPSTSSHASLLLFTQPPSLPVESHSGSSLVWKCCRRKSALVTSKTLCGCHILLLALYWTA